MTTQDHLGVKLQEAYLSLKVKKNLLRAQEECKRALGQLDAARNQVNLLTSYLDNAMRERDVAKAKLDDAQKDIEQWRKLTQSLKDDKNLLEGQLLGCRKTNQVLRDKLNALENYGGGQTATEVLEVQNLKREISGQRDINDSLRRWLTHLRTELEAERTAHNKLKALCNERGFGTPLFYTPPIKPDPIWEVSFYRNGNHIGAITYNYAPSAKLLNDLQESLKATSWKMTYRG